MTDRFESILDESISALQAGVPIEEVLAEVPEYASELRPLLYAAMLLADPNPKLVPEETKAALHAKYMAQVAELPPVPPSFSHKTQAVYRVIKRRLTPRAVLNDLTTIFITVVLTLTMVALVLGFAAQDTIPGDLLYSVKRMSETARLALTFNEDSRGVLEAQFTQRRLDEIQELLSQNRAAVVEFRGTVDTQTENLWIIEGLTVLLPDDTVIKGNPQEGDTVDVIGILRTNNVLVADTIKRIE